MTDYHLRVVTSADAAAIAAIYRPYVEETAITFEETPPDAEEMTRRIEKKRPTYPWFVAERDEEIIGYAYAGPLRDREAYRWTVELSVYVDRTRRGEGAGSTLYRALLRTLERQGFESAYGVVTLPNPESVGFHEALGFQRVALLPASGYKLGKWHDVAWYERSLGERTDDPSSPTPFAECRDASWVEATLSEAASGSESGE